MLLARGYAAAAIVRFGQAAARAPRYADAQSGWGQALLAKGDAKGADAKFRAADAVAPRWGRNHLLWGDALARLGRPAEARGQWSTARSLDLSAADRSLVDQHLRGV